jgi:hypothetical protein
MIVTIAQLRKLARTDPDPRMRLIFRAILAEEGPVRQIPQPTKKVKDETAKEERPRSQVG